MKSLKLTVIITLSLLHASCSNNQQQNTDLKSIDLAGNIDNLQVLNISEFAEDIEYVPLETNEDIVLGDYLRFDISDEYITAVDRNKSMVLFDRAGRFISKFGQQGRGPEEYQDIKNLTIENNRIFFSSMADLFEFNTLGEFVNKYPGILNIENKHLLEHWCIIDDSLIFGHIANGNGQTDIKAMLINKKGQTLGSYKNYDILDNKGSRINGGSTHIYKFGGSIFFKEQFTDTLFRLTKDYELQPYYSFNMADLKMPASVRSNFREYFQKMNDYVAIEGIYESNSDILLDINYGNRFPAKRLNPKPSQRPGGKPEEFNTTHCLGIYNLKSEELKICKPTSTDNPLFTSGIYNDFDAGPRFFPDKMINDSEMVMVIPAKEFKDHVSDDDFKNSSPKQPDKKEYLKELAARLSESDNPVLMIVRFSD